MAVKWIAYPLHPETPEEGTTLARLFAGRDIDIPAAKKHLAAVAEELGLPYGDREMTYNSRRAQELGKWAEEKGKGDAFHDLMFRAYFVDGLNIAGIGVLKDLAVSIGLDGNEAKTVLSEGTYQKAVDRDWAYSRERGITAVPTFSAGDFRVVGAQPYETLAQLVKLSGPGT